MDARIENADWAFFLKRKDSIDGRIVTACCLSVMILALVKRLPAGRKQKERTTSMEGAASLAILTSPSAPKHDAVGRASRMAASG